MDLVKRLAALIAYRLQNGTPSGLGAFRIVSAHRLVETPTVRVLLESDEDARVFEVTITEVIR